MKHTEHTPPISPAATASGLNEPTNGKYHDQTPLTRLLLVASAGKKLWATIQRVPNFYPAEWPLGGVVLYLALIGAGIYSGVILSLLMSLSGNPLLSIGLPALIAVLEFIVVPGIKHFSLRDKQIAMMKAFVAEDRAARDSATHAATAWNWKDWVVLIILLLCLMAKMVVLVQFGAYQPQALLAANWTIALLDFAFHISGTTTRVPCFVGARLTDWLHLRRRHSRGYKRIGDGGKTELGSLAFREFPFTTKVMIRGGEVDGHTIVHTGSDESGHHFLLKAPGTLDDRVRDAFLNCQPNHLAQTSLAVCLAKCQLELLTAPEMRSIHEIEPSALPSPILAVPQNPITSIA